MRVDGALREWKGARFSELRGAGDESLRYALAVADGGLYIAAEISDAELVRGKGVGGRQDAVVLMLAMPDVRGQWTSTEIWLHPGRSGVSKSVAGLKRGASALKEEGKISVVEGPRDGGQPGYVIEAFVPWSLVGEAEIWEMGRGALRYEDYDQGGRPSVLATSQAKPDALPRLRLGEGHQDFLGSFLASQNLTGIEPRYDFRGNVHGDAATERVVLVDRFVVVYGPAYQKGESFGYLALPISVGGGVKHAELTDLDGDGRAELALTLRQANSQGAREVFLVYSLAEDSPRALGGVELRKETAGGFIENTLSKETKGKEGLRFVAKLGRSQNLSPDNYREASASDVQPILLPWGEVRSRTYALRDRQWVVLSEERDPKAAQAAQAAAKPAASAALAQDHAVEVEPTLDAVLALFRRDRKLPAKLAPRRHQRANVLGGPTREELFELGNHLVLVGQDINEGTSYLAYGLPVKDASEILYVGHGDVTGDGKEELFVRLHQPLTGADGVHREVVLVLGVEEQGRFRRLLAAEVVRRQGERAIINRVNTKSGSLIIEPGGAEGWSASDYPFTSDATGGVERLLLPWQDSAVQYRLAGEALVPSP